MVLVFFEILGTSSGFLVVSANASVCGCVRWEATIVAGVLVAVEIGLWLLLKHRAVAPSLHWCLKLTQSVLRLRRATFPIIIPNRRQLIILRS